MLWRFMPPSPPIVLVALIFACPQTARATIILQQLPPVPLASSGLVQYTISAVGTAGEVIDTFNHLTINPLGAGKGIHNVAQLVTNDGTPTKTEHAPSLFNPAFEPYDTYFLFGNDDLAADLGTSLSETNDGSTTPCPCLPPVSPRQGFGTFNSAADSTKVLLPTKAGSNVPFIQVVMRAQDQASLSVRIFGDSGDSIGDFTGASAFTLGSDPLPLMIVDANVGCVFPGFQTVTHTFQANQPVTNWQLVSLLGPDGSQPVSPPTFSSTTGTFTWTPHLADFGGRSSATWIATVFGSNEFGSDTGTLTMFVFFCPEPASVSLVGLAMLGLVGLVRRRS